MSDPMRLAVIFLATVGCLGAGIPDDRLADAGGVVDLDSSGQIVAVDLHASWATDSDIAELVRLPNLSRLDLSLTRISDHGLRQLKDVPAITDLNLRYDELITDAEPLPYHEGLATPGAVEPAWNQDYWTRRLLHLNGR